jgi:endonuclease-8
MPEGDTIFRAARTLHRALAGRTVTRFESVYPQLTRVDEDAPLAGRTIESVDARGKHLLMHFSGNLVLRTHMRMSGSWHIYRPNERWQRPRRDMRVVVATDAFEAVAFNVPVAEFTTARKVNRADELGYLGPDLLSSEFDAAEVVGRIRARSADEVGNVLVDQRALAGIGNIYKSETLFVCRVNPFTRIDSLTPEQVQSLVSTAQSLMQANVRDFSGDGIATHPGLRRTTRLSDPAARLWVYGRTGRPCRTCGTPIESRLQGPDARRTFWCPVCQPS